MNPPILREAVTTIRHVQVTATAQKFIYTDAHRRFVLVQNLSTTESVEISSTQGSGGEMIPPTGARLIDAPNTNELWMRNPNNNNSVTVVIEEVSGYSPWEIRVLSALETIANAVRRP